MSSSARPRTCSYAPAVRDYMPLLALETHVLPSSSNRYQSPHIIPRGRFRLAKRFVEKRDASYSQKELLRSMTSIETKARSPKVKASTRRVESTSTSPASSDVCVSSSNSASSQHNGKVSLSMSERRLAANKPALRGHLTLNSCPDVPLPLGKLAAFNSSPSTPAQKQSTIPSTPPVLTPRPNNRRMCSYTSRPIHLRVAPRDGSPFEQEYFRAAPSRPSLLSRKLSYSQTLCSPRGFVHDPSGIFSNYDLQSPVILQST